MWTPPTHLPRKLHYPVWLALCLLYLLRAMLTRDFWTGPWPS